jgi:hypothetical protein
LSWLKMENISQLTSWYFYRLLRTENFSYRLLHWTEKELSNTSSAWSPSRKLLISKVWWTFTAVSIVSLLARTCMSSMHTWRVNNFQNTALCSWILSLRKELLPSTISNLP